VRSLPPLSLDDQDDASFRAQDRAWAAVVALFHRREEEEGLTYEGLGKRIGRRRQQVQRWLASAFNMNTRSLGLLAEGLNADLLIELRPRVSIRSRNFHHPSVAARAALMSQGQLAIVSSLTQAGGSDRSGTASQHTTTTRILEDV
jgi:hypothetical protein